VSITNYNHIQSPLSLATSNSNITSVSLLRLSFRISPAILNALSACRRWCNQVRFLYLLPAS